MSQELETVETGVQEQGAERGVFPRFANPKKEAFLMAVVETGGSIPQAAEAMNCSKWSHYSWMRDDPDYARAFEEIAKPLIVDTLRAEVIRRGKDGYEEPLVYQGKLTGDKVRRYSDNLLMFETKRQDPLYRDNQGAQVGIMASGPVQIGFSEPEADVNQVRAARPNGTGGQAAAPDIPGPGWPAAGDQGQDSGPEIIIEQGQPRPSEGAKPVDNTPVDDITFD